MVLDLLERDQEEALRVSSRTLAFPDGKSRTIETFRLIWRWYDKIVAYRFCLTEKELLTATLRRAERENISIKHALDKEVEYSVIVTERMGGDLTDDNVEAYIARKAAHLKSSKA